MSTFRRSTSSYWKSHTTSCRKSFLLNVWVRKFHQEQNDWKPAQAPFVQSGGTNICSLLETRPPGNFQPNTCQTHTTGLNTPKLILNCPTVTTRPCITPGNDASIFQNRSKGKISCLNLPHTPEPISNCRTVTANSSVTPGDHGPISQNRSKGPIGSLNLLHTPELISKWGAVTATASITPGNDRSVCQNRSKCKICGVNLPHTPELILNCRTVAPKSASPQVIIDRSSKIAAKAPSRAAWICCTPLSWSWTAALSPP